MWVQCLHRRKRTHEFTRALSSPRIMFHTRLTHPPCHPGRLEQLVGMYNKQTLPHHPGLQYRRGRTPVSGKVMCTSVHSHARSDMVCQLLQHRLSWVDNAQVQKDDLALFMFFLRGKLVWSCVCCVVIAVPDSLHAADAEHIPQPRTAGAWR